MQNYSEDDHLQELMNLLPEGDAWPKDHNSNLGTALRPLAQQAARITQSANAIAADIYPATTTNYLEEWEATFGLPNECTVMESFSRSSPATMLLPDGALVRVAADVLRRPNMPDPTPLVESAATNYTRNPWGLLAVLSSQNANGEPTTSGTMPTHWTCPATFNGINRYVVEQGISNGIPYVGLRFKGTPTASGGQHIAFDATSAAPIGSGTTFTGSFFVRLAAGSNANTSFRILAQDSTGANAPVIISPSGNVLGLQRVSATFTTGASATGANMVFRLNYTIGQPLDVTVWLGAPQLELGSTATSVVLPIGNVIDQSTRAEDLYVPPATVEQRRQQVMARLVAKGGASKAYFENFAAALGYTITINEYQSTRAGVFRPGQRLTSEMMDYTWEVVVVSGPSNGLLECELRRIKPAHTRLAFKYV